MPKQLLRWLWKTASDLHNVLIALIVASILTTHHFGTIVKNTQNVLLYRLELWIVIAAFLSILLFFLILFRIRSFFPPILNRTQKYIIKFIYKHNPQYESDLILIIKAKTKGKIHNKLILNSLEKLRKVGFIDKTNISIPPKILNIDSNGWCITTKGIKYISDNKLDTP